MPAHLEDYLVDLQSPVCPVPLTGFHYCSNPSRSSHMKTYARGWSWTAFSDGMYSTKDRSPTQTAALEERVKQMELEDMCHWTKAKEESQV